MRRRTAGRARSARGWSLKSSAGRGGRSERAEQPVAEDVAQVVGQLAASPSVAAAGELGAGQVGATLGHPAHVRHGVVLLLQLRAVARARPGSAPERRRLIQHPPDTGGSTATSSPARPRRGLGRVAVDPDPARRQHVGERRSVALAGGAEHVADRGPRQVHAPVPAASRARRTCARSPRSERTQPPVPVGAPTAVQQGDVGPPALRAPRAVDVEPAAALAGSGRSAAQRRGPRRRRRRWPPRSARRSVIGPRRRVVVGPPAGRRDGRHHRRPPRRRPGRDRPPACARPTSARGRV